MTYRLKIALTIKISNLPIFIKKTLFATPKTLLSNKMNFLPTPQPPFGAWHNMWTALNCFWGSSWRQEHKNTEYRFFLRASAPILSHLLDSIVNQNNPKKIQTNIKNAKIQEKSEKVQRLQQIQKIWRKKRNTCLKVLKSFRISKITQNLHCFLFFLFFNRLLGYFFGSGKFLV